jgi:hypothetical protein
MPEGPFTFLRFVMRSKKLESLENAPLKPRTTFHEFLDTADPYKRCNISLVARSLLVSSSTV